MEVVRGILVLADLGDLVLERQEYARVDLEREMEVEGAVAALVRVQVDLPRLAERIRLDEMTLVMNVKAMVDRRMILEIGDVSGHIDDCHETLLRRGTVRVTGRAAGAAYRCRNRMLPGRMQPTPWVCVGTLPGVSMPSPTVPSATFDELGGWPAVLALLTSNTELPAEVAVAAFTEILEGRATPAQVAGFAIGLRTKGETVGELTAVLRTMLAFAVRVPLTDEIRAKAICTCGTGGDRSHSINISTTATFLVAGAGGIVCKHGGRAASSQSGSADVLEALGVALEITPAGVARCVTEAGVGFCLAPRFHPAMRHAAPTRRELGVATLFNFLGPMANPGLVRRQAVGVSDPTMAPRMAEVLRAQGADRAVVMYGHDGLDELSTTTTSTLLLLDDGVITESTIDPSTYGFARVTLDDLRGGTATENAVHVRNVLSGQRGAHRDIVVINAAAGLLAAGIAGDLGDGVRRAAVAIDDGSAMHALDELIRVSNEAHASEG